MQLEISSVFDRDGSIFFFCMMFMMAELPKVAVPFIIKRFTHNLYQRHAILVFGGLVIGSNVLVFMGLRLNIGFIALLGRTLFGLFSVALDCNYNSYFYYIASIHFLFGKWQALNKHSPYHL